MPVSHWSHSVLAAQGMCARTPLLPACTHMHPCFHRRYSNARGEGKFFSFDLLDGEGGEIRVVCWNDQVHGRARR